MARLRHRVRRYVDRLQTASGRREAYAEDEVARASTVLSPTAADSSPLDIRVLSPALAAPSSDVEEVIAAVMAENLSYIGHPGLRTLAQMVADLEADQVPGDVLEAGCALGGSAIVLTKAKNPQRRLRIFDVFGMIPPPGSEDGPDVHERYQKIVGGESTGLGGEQYYGYRSDLMREVTESFERHGLPIEANNVELVCGLFADTLVVDGPVALAHLDGDWYESTMTCLTRIVPHLVRHGRLVIDDYFIWSGCKAAVDEYFAGRSGFRFEQLGKLHIVRV